MARINIEDSLFKDGRFTNLCIKLGSRRLAIGAIVEAWILAQSHVSPENPSGILPAAEWQLHEIAPEILQCKLAKELENGMIEISGGKESFSWLVQKQEAAKKGGDAKALKAKNTMPIGSRVAAERLPGEAEICPPTLIPPLSLTPILSSSSSSQVAKVKPNPEDSEQNKLIKQEYINAYRSRYGVDPSTSGAAFNSQVSNLRKKLGVEESIKVVRFYLTHNKSFYLSNTHSFKYCLSDAETLRTQMLRGQAITQADVRNFEQQNHHLSQIERIKKGSV